MDDDELVNELHGLLSHEVLFVYVRWMVYGRLVQVTPPSASLESLMSRAQASAYRLPLLAFAAACSDLWRDRKSVQGTDSPVWPVELKARDDCGPGRISAVTLANYFSQLRGWARGEMAAVVVDNRVVEALSSSVTAALGFRAPHHSETSVDVDSLSMTRSSMHDSSVRIVEPWASVWPSVGHVI
jgi:hypothetical protein